MKYKYIFLDIDDTLYEYKPCHNAGLNALCRFVSETFSVSSDTAEELYQKSRKETGDRLHGQGASHSRLLYSQGICEKLNVSPANYALLIEGSYWNAFLSEMKLRPFVNEFLDTAVRNGCRIGIITDLTAGIQFEKIKRFGIQDKIHSIVTSEEAGAEKPDARIYQLALEKLKAEKSLSIMIGDSMEKDVLGARKFGISACLFGKQEGENEQTESFQNLLKYI